MINLLPQSEKKELQKQLRLRYAVAILCVVFILELVTFMVFIPSYLGLFSATSTLKQSLESKMHTAAPGDDIAQSELTAITNEMTLLRPVSDGEIVPTMLIAKILAKKPDGITVNRFAFSQNAGLRSVEIGGIAKTQEDRLLFQKQLKEEILFKEVRSPQNLVKKTNIDFQVSIILK